MKRLGITQRVEFIPSYHERRDCLDQRWASFSFELGFMPIPLPNLPPEKVLALLTTLSLDGILLSGGNSIATFNADATTSAPERDAFEYKLIEEARKMAIPLVGICRGMQMINLSFGGNISPIKHHVACRHILDTDQTYSAPIPEEVNSYHDWGIAANELAAPLSPIATDQQGYIEGFVHKSEAILGIMWHPERENPFNLIDMNLLKKIL